MIIFLTVSKIFIFKLFFWYKPKIFHHFANFPRKIFIKIFLFTKRIFYLIFQFLFLLIFRFSLDAGKFYWYERARSVGFMNFFGILQINLENSGELTTKLDDFPEKIWRILWFLYFSPTLSNSSSSSHPKQVKESPNNPNPRLATQNKNIQRISRTTNVTFATC